MNAIMVSEQVTAEGAGTSAPAADRPEAVVEFREAAFASASAVLERIDGTVRRGECAWVEGASIRDGGMLADAAQGLVRPIRGAVLVGGRDWAGMKPRAAGRIRGGIGRVFAESGWVSNLDVDENILLRVAHRSWRFDRSLRGRMDVVAERLGVAPVPEGRPARVPHARLQEMQWVRAFLGDPELIVLERPMAGVPSSRLEALAAEVARATRRGGAVLWIAGPDEAATRLALPIHWRFRLDDSGWAAVEGEGP